MSADRSLRLQVILSAIDKVSRPIKGMATASKGTSQELKALRDRLKEINQTSATISKFREVSKVAAITANQLKAAQDKVKQLNSAMAAGSEPGKAMAKSLADAKREAADLKIKHGQLIERQQRLRDTLNQAGIATKGLAQKQLELKGQAKGAADAIRHEEDQLKKLNRVQQRFHDARANFQRMNTLNERLGGSAMYAGGVKDSILQGLRNPMGESKSVQTEQQRLAALGLGDIATRDAIRYASAMRTYGTSTRDNITMMRDAMTVFADEHHAQMVVPTLAKMKFANHAMFGEEQATDNERKFMDMLKVIELRGGLASEKAFRQQANIVQQVITATGGRVAGSEWLDMIKTGGLAAKGMDDKSFYYKMEPLVQEMGGNRTGTALMSAYQNLYQGKTTKRSARLLDDLGLIGDRSKVQHDKTGQLSYLNPGALKGSALFRTSQFDWMEKVLLPTLASKGITGKDKILDAIGGIFSNRTAANLFSQMYLQRDQIHKNARLNAGADGIDQLADRAKGTAAGQELDMAAKRANLYKQMGDSIMPAYTKALELTNSTIQQLTTFMQQNPTAAKVILITLAAIAIGIAGMATVLGPLALISFGMSTLGIQAGASAGGVGMLGGAFGGVCKGIMAVGRTIGAVGKLLLTNPIGIAIALLAGAAYLIWDNWDTLGPKFQALWQGIKDIVSAAGDWIMSFLMNWTPVGFIADHWEDLKAITLAIWQLIKDSVAGFAQGIVDFFMEWTIVGTVVRHWDDITAAASSAWQWIKDTATAAGQGIVDFFMNWTIVGTIVRHWDSITAFLSGLVDKFKTIGAQIMNGLVDGIVGGITYLKNAINGTGESMIGWLKEKLGIHSPSRVFAMLGHFTMAGLTQGITGGQDGPLAAVRDIASKLAAAGAGIALSAGAAAGTIQLDQRPPLTAAAPAATSSGGNTYIFQISTAPGMDEARLASLIERKVRDIQRQQDARSRSRLRDSD